MKKNKNHIDQEIQEALDRQSSFNKEEMLEMHEDVELYTTLFNKLEEEPDLQLGDDFSNRVIEAANKKKKVNDILWKLALYASVSLSLIAMSVIVVFAMDAEVFWKTMESLKENMVYLIFGVSIFTFIQLLDKTLVKKKLQNLST